MTKYAAASTTSYGYNGDGLRMCKVAGSSTQPCQAGGNTQFLWDVAGSLPLTIRDGTTSYIYGPGGLPLEQVSGSTTFWYHHDQIGSTRLVTNSTGVSQATYTYDPYGGLASSTGSITNPFRFCGQYQDSESAFYYLRARYYDYLRARYYDPNSAQFATFDPATRSTRTPYAYVLGSPLTATDPMGLWCAGVTAGAISWLGIRGASQDWAVGVCDNGDLYASSTNGELKPGQKGNGTWGLFGSAGLGVQASSNASCAKQLGGPFHQAAAGAGLGPSATFTTASAKGVDVQGFSIFPMPGAGAGLGVSAYDTNTNIVSWNWVQHLVNDPAVAAAQTAVRRGIG